MRKLLALILSFVLLISASVVAFSDDISETLSAVGILPTFTGGDGDPITRQELAYMTAELVRAEAEPKPTRFADVLEDNIYSGHIEYLASLGVVNGTGGGSFNPKDDANFGMAAKMIINAMGYGSFAEVYGGYPNGYMEVLSRLGLSKGVNLAADAVLTVADAKLLFHNALTMEINGITYTEINGDTNGFLTSSKNESLLAGAFGVSVYEGTVTDVSDDGAYLDITITRNKYKTNPVLIDAGINKTFAAHGSIMAEAFYNVPVTIWVDENETIIKISPQKDVEIKYVSIASVNGDTREGQPYAIGNITEMTFLDDETEYGMSENVVMLYNGVSTVSPRELTGKFAKVVLKEEEIIFIETWDLEKGGLITEFNGANITYMNDEGSQKVLREIADHDKVTVIIGKRAGSLSEIKPDTLFSYYENDGYVVVVVSERKIIDRFVSISAEELTIGEMAYLRGDVRYSEDAKHFTDDYAQFLNRDVAAYIGPDSKVWLVMAVSGDSAVSEFYGIVSGIQMDNLDPENGKIELYKIADAQISKEIYEITKKTELNDLLTLDILKANAKNTKGEGIYLFKVNSLGRITSVSLPQPLYGFATGVGAVSSFSDSTAFATIDSKGLYFDGQPILGIYKDDDGFAAEFMSWSAISGKSVGAGTMRFFGKGKDSVPSLIVLSGDLASLGSYDKYGVITDVMDASSDNGDLLKQVTVISMSGTRSYMMLPEDAEGLKKNTWITFNDNVTFNESEIIISSTTDLSGDYESWDYKKGIDTEGGLHMGVAETADKNRIVLRSVYSDTHAVSDSAYFYHPSQNFFVAYYPDAPVAKFKAATYADIDDGDVVFWNYRGDGLRGVIVVKD